MLLFVLNKILTKSLFSINTASISLEKAPTELTRDGSSKYGCFNSFIKSSSILSNKSYTSK